MAPAIGMQMSLVLLGLSSGLQLGRHRYARKVNQLPGMGGWGSDGLESHRTSNAAGTESTFKNVSNSQVHIKTRLDSNQLK